MKTQRDMPPQPDKPSQLNVERIRLLEQLRTKMKTLNRLLEEFDVHGVSTQTEKVAFFEALATQGVELISSFRKLVKEQGGSARARILRYLQAHIGQIVEGATLDSVSGVSDWARRVRELDVELGYRITTHETDTTLRHGQYRLESATPDTERAAWWRVKHRLRHDKELSLQDKVLSLLRERSGRPVEEADFDYVAKGKDWKAHLHKLQSDGAGCKISTCRNRPDLEPDEYVLEAET